MGKTMRKTMKKRDEVKLFEDGELIAEGGIGERFSFKTVHIDPAGHCASYFMAIPISPLSYRKRNPTRTRAEMTETESPDYVIFRIWDDWGMEYALHIRKDSRRAIAGLKRELEAENLLRR